jgi:hypothetical protein
MTESDRHVAALKRELHDIEYCIRIRAEDLALYYDRKAEVERQLHIYNEGESKD